jgi:hypothetical protein
VNVHLIRTDGREEFVDMEFRAIREAIAADGLDSVNLRDGRVMLVDDTGLIDGKPLNRKATELYHGVCYPGTTHPIAGDVAIVVDAEVA